MRKDMDGLGFQLKAVKSLIYSIYFMLPFLIRCQVHLLPHNWIATISTDLVN